MFQAKKQFFDDHAEEWLEKFYKDPETGLFDKHKKDFDRLFALFTLKSGDTVLDAGCGTGVLVPYILKRIGLAGTLYELDYSEKMLEINQRMNKLHNNINFIKADAESVHLGDESCDVVICFSSFPHFYDKQKALNNLSRILKPKGKFVLSHFCSSDEIKKHHANCHAVSHDYLPDEITIREMFNNANLSIDFFIDEPGFYCLIAKKNETLMYE